MEGKSSACKAFASVNVIELATETYLHFRGLRGLSVEPIFLFPKTVVCLDCGFMWSILAQQEIEQVRRGSASSRGASA